MYCMYSCVASGCRRCPATEVLNLLFYSTDRLSWGVRFAVPKYQSYDSLYVACSAYICDSAVTGGAQCDRSCVETSEREADTVQSRPATASLSRRRSRPRRGHGDRRRHQLHQLQTHFTVADEGFGPLIDNDGQLHLIRRTRQ